MNKKIGIVGVLLIIIVVVGRLFYKGSKEIVVSEKSDADLSFAVLSDIHGNDGKFKNAVNDLYSINSFMDAMILNGDTVDQGTDAQYDNMKEALKDNEDRLPNKIIKNVGNHEYYDYNDDETSSEDTRNRVNRYLEFAGEDKTYHDTWIKNYHFISLGTDYIGEESIHEARISDEEFAWLSETIKEKYEKGKPIFVFLHQPIDMKFFNVSVTGVDRNQELKDILLQYPEVILFTSHTHLTTDEVVDNEHEITTINTGSVNNNYIEDTGEERGFKLDSSISNGIYIEVHGNKVTAKSRDFKNNTWIYTRVI